MTPSFPLCCILMELSAQLELRGILLDLNWSRRTENVLADKLSNGFFEDFDPLLRVEVDLKKMNWIILHHILKWAPKLFEENVPRPWHCGILYDCSENLGKHCIEFLKQKYKLMVGDNEPYGVNNSSDYIISKFGDKQSIPAIIIEIRQDLISDFKGQKKWSNIVKNLITSCLYNYNN